MVRTCLSLNIALLCTIVGCGGSPYEVAPVSGAIKLNDKPLAQGAILFSPVGQGENINPGKAAVGLIQSDGTYTLTTFEDKDGAVVGEHWVTIVNHDEENVPDGVPEYARIQVPEKKTVVAGKQNQIDIVLSRDDVRKYREDDR